jgi:hypothetical protein
MGEFYSHDAPESKEDRRKGVDQQPENGIDVGALIQAIFRLLFFA